jgi:hypothetical protein
MVEHGSRSGQIFQKETGGRPSGSGEGLSKGNIFRQIKSAFNTVLALLGGKPSGAAAKPAASLKIMEAALNIHKLDLKTVNRVLVLVLVALSALAFYFGLSERPDIDSLTAAVSKARYEPPEETAIASFGELSAYLQEVKTRDIFNQYEEPKPPPPVVKKVEPPPPPPPPKVTVQEKAKDLKLLGISWGESPKAMIKNNVTGEVLFLETGQKIKGTEIQVKSVDKDKVIIESDGDEMKML